MESKIDEILNSVFLTKSTDMGLYTGLSGHLLLGIEYSKFKDIPISDEIIALAQLISEESIHYPYLTFSNGKSGVNWLYNYLQKINVIDSEDCDILCSDVTMLQQFSLNELSNGNWDMLHGSLGIAYSLLYNYKSEYYEYFVSIFKGLNRICEENIVMKMFPNFYFEKQVYKMDEVNLGLAHGIPSILKFCIQCYRQNVCKMEAITLGTSIIRFLQNHTNTYKEMSYFPPFAAMNVLDVESRVAWCYGDLGVGVILYQAGMTFGYKKVVEFAMEILIHTTRRNSLKEANVFDAGICHGSAGIAYIYNKMWHCTAHSQFKEATDFWMRKTLDFAYHEDGVAGYKMCHAKDNSYHNVSGLLEGAAGVGLVLLSYLTGDFSWDYCLMLND